MKEVFSARREGNFSGPGWGGLREPRFYRFEYYPNCVRRCVYIVETDSRLVLILASYAKSPMKVIHILTLPYRQA